MDNLIDITMKDDTERVYMLGMGCFNENLTEEEKLLLNRSNEYLKQKEINRNKQLVKHAYDDFEKLSQIKNMPIEALRILAEWVHVDGFDEEDD